MAIAEKRHFATTAPFLYKNGDVPGPLNFTLQEWRQGNACEICGRLGTYVVAKHGRTALLQ